MALTMNQNLYAQSSQYYLGVNQNALSKSIERLSSGLRINHASDDASGMAISEQMRGQITGLKRASMNAQDGISYLQTAEGAMEQTTSMLQRMRELAVQAANGIYTTNDRAEIQKEVDQLKAEIDRVSVATEFNTRKMINGSGTALWSADTSKLKAIIRGPVAEGNYEISMTVKPGKNQIFKTDIMTLNEDAIGAEIATSRANTTNVGTVSDPVSMPSTGTAYYTINVKNSASVTAFQMSAYITANPNPAAGDTLSAGTTLNREITLSADFTIPVGTTLTLPDGTVLTNASDTSAGAVLPIGTKIAGAPGLTIGANTNVNNIGLSAGSTATRDIIISAGYTPEYDIVLKDGTVYSAGSSVPAGAIIPAGTVFTADFTYGDKTNVSGSIPAKAEMASTYQHDGASWAVTDVTSVASSAATATVANSHSGYMEIEFLNTTTSTGTAQYRMRFIDAATGDMGEWQTATGTSAGFSAVYNDGTHSAAFDVDITIGLNSSIVKGDKMLVAISRYVEEDGIAEGGGSIEMAGGPSNGAAPTIYYTAAESLTLKDNGDAILDTKSTTVYNASMDSKTGNINVGNVTLNFKEQATGVTAEGSFDLAIQGGGEAATTSTKLKDIARFVNADGTNIFEMTQELTIFGNGTSTVIHIEGNDTVATLIEKMNKAIVTGLGMGSDDPQVNSNLVRYISTPDSTGWGTLKGTFLIQTALTGNDGRLSFVGDQSLIDAFSMAEVQKAVNGESTVTVRDAHTGALVGTEITGDDRVYTLIDGVELVIDSRAGVTSTWNSAKNQIEFSSDTTLGDKKMHIHIVDNRTSLQIGANKGQDLDVSIPQLDVYGLGLENTVIVTQDLAREAIGQIDRALQRVISARATIGAQVSRLEYTVQNLATSRENLTTSESRIRDLDVADESTNFTNNQILVQSGVAMLAQANQLPQMALQLIQG